MYLRVEILRITVLQCRFNHIPSDPEQKKTSMDRSINIILNIITLRYLASTRILLYHCKRYHLKWITKTYDTLNAKTKVSRPICNPMQWLPRVNPLSKSVTISLDILSIARASHFNVPSNTLSRTPEFIVSLKCAPENSVYTFYTPSSFLSSLSSENVSNWF